MEHSPNQMPNSHGQISRERFSFISILGKDVKDLIPMKMELDFLTQHRNQLC